jgi:hypothetical protein
MSSLDPLHPSRLRRGWLVLALLCLVVFGATPAYAGLVGDAAVPYSATRTVIADGKAYVGRMWSAPGMQRHEQTVNGVRMVLILRADQHVLWLIAPDFHVYTSLPLSDTLTRYADRSRLGFPVGEEDIDGVPARKYRIHNRDQNGAEVDGFLWLDRDGIVRKLAGVYTAPHGHRTPVTLLLSNIRTGDQDPALFEVPPGFSMLPPQAVAPLLGMQVP